MRARRGDHLGIIRGARLLSLLRRAFRRLTLGVDPRLLRGARGRLGRLDGGGGGGGGSLFSLLDGFSLRDGRRLGVPLPSFLRALRLLHRADGRLGSLLLRELRREFSLLSLLLLLLPRLLLRLFALLGAVNLRRHAFRFLLLGDERLLHLNRLRLGKGNLDAVGEQVREDVHLDGPPAQVRQPPLVPLNRVVAGERFVAAVRLRIGIERIDGSGSLEYG